MPRDCADPWQEFAFEPVGGDPTGEWEIELNCVETAGKVSFSPPCDEEYRASYYSEHSVEGSFVFFGGVVSWLQFESGRAWVTWPLECIPADFCASFSGPIRGGQGEEIGWVECSEPAGSEACHCYEEYVDHTVAQLPYRVDGSTIELGTDGYMVQFSVIGDRLQWLRQAEGNRDLMIARRRRGQTGEQAP